MDMGKVALEYQDKVYKEKSTPTTKICSSCKHEKLLSDFNNMKASKDGKQNICKACKKESYLANKELKTKKREFLQVKEIDSKFGIRTSNTLHHYTARELIQELRERGYSGTLKLTKEVIV